ncbi:WD40 repeat domain-containing protein [Nocardioides okcheonensis]|uniref:WD40 repeat domain-containing protein n=1 Tax=Nocardioides okcheonensis TaxID=2894081 RepID=UPI001E604E29|nr:WD40 repeat domain-containing protein [Nocardioides okcheonensis]UFN43316.1 WD40 repeat domain-containing protein [Nocardioides okcheonensis]
MTPQTEHLRTTLHRLADAGVPLPVDDDLWGRAQSARRRGQALAVAAVLVLVVSVGGAAALWSLPEREARTASSEVVAGGAIPRVIADAPDDIEPTADLAVGRASAAFVSGDGDPVVVTADDGVPHVLDLPSFGPDRAAFALSPDGRRLAYQQGAESGTRLAVLDLESGRTTPLIVEGSTTLEIDGLSWSPGGNWVGWVASAVADTPAWTGVHRVDGGEGSRAILAGNASSIAVADDGASAVGSVQGDVRLIPLHAEVGQIRRAAPGLAAGAFSPDGSLLALGSGPGRGSSTLDAASREVLRHPFPDGTLGESVVRPLGWVDDRIQLLLVQPVDGSGAELVVTTPEVDDQSIWRRRVGSVETSGVANSLSVAVDLVPDLDGTSSQELTHDFGATTPERDVSWLIGLGVAGAIAALMALRWLWRRLRTPL